MSGNKSGYVERTVSDISVGAMTERMLSTASQSFPVKKEIPMFILKQLIDKNYDKRKQAGNELHKVLSSFVEKGNIDIIKNAIELFKIEYIDSPSEILKKAGLMAYSALSSTLMLNEETCQLTPFLISPVIFCFRDSDSKIRYSAVESMYNIAKICRGIVLESFDSIFKPMSDLFADNDINVKKAVEKLDLLLKTLVVECEADKKLFNSNKFMTIIKEMMLISNNPNVQMLLISWITVLDTIPNFSIVVYLPNYFEGLFTLLGSKNETVRKTAYNFSKELLNEVNLAAPTELDLLFVMEMLSKFVGHSEEIVRNEAILWTSELLDKSDRVLFKIFPIILRASLQCIADQSGLVSEKAYRVNAKLMKFIRTTSRDTTISQYEDIVDVFMVFLNHDSIETRKVTLEWIILLQGILPESIESKLGILLETLTNRIKSAEEVIFELILQILCRVAEYKGYFTKVVYNLLKLFSSNQLLLDKKASEIIKFLCAHLGTEKVIQNFGTILQLNPDHKFIEKMIIIINDLIMTDPSLESLRDRLKNCLIKDDIVCIELFSAIFKTWCNNPVSALCLTFLVQAYELSYRLLEILYEIFRSRCKITSDLLTQLAKFVHFLNSPVFLCMVHLDLRLQLLEHYKQPYLLKSLYAILMILPNSKAYLMLQERLKDISSLHKNLPAQTMVPGRKSKYLKMDELKNYFIEANLSVHKRRGMNNFLELSEKQMIENRYSERIGKNF